MLLLCCNFFHCEHRNAMIVCLMLDCDSVNMELFFFTTLVFALPLSIFESLCSPARPTSKRVPHYFIHCLITKQLREWKMNEWQKHYYIFPAQHLLHLVIRKYMYMMHVCNILRLPLCNSVMLTVRAQQFNRIHCKLATKERQTDLKSKNSTAISYWVTMKTIH